MLLLTGATGLLGHAVVRRLVARGTPVRCLVRDPRRLGPERVRVQLAIGDLADPGELAQRAARRRTRSCTWPAARATSRARPSRSSTGWPPGGCCAPPSASAREHFVWIAPLGATPHHPMRMHRAKALAAVAVAESRAADDDARALADLLARRPPPAVARAARLPARGAARRARDRPHAADLGRGRRRLRARRARRPAGAATRATSSPGPETLTQHEVVRLVLAAAGRRRRALPLPLAGLRAALRAEETLAGPDRARDLGRGAAARRRDAQRDRDRGRRGARRHARAGCGRGSGRWCAHGCAASICAASCSSVSSLSGLPTIWTPVGSPSAPKPTGSEIAGWPVMLNSAVYGVKQPERARSRERVLAEPVALADRAAAARPAPASRARRSRRRTPPARAPAPAAGPSRSGSRSTASPARARTAPARAARSRRRPARGRRAARRS